MGRSLSRRPPAGMGLGATFRHGDARDASSNANTMTVSGATFSHPSAYDFDGSNDEITSSTFTASLPLTLSAWVNPDSFSGLSIAYYGSVDDEYGIVMVPTGFWALSQVGNANVQAESTTTINFGTWYHVVGAFVSSTSRKIYVDGVLQGEQSAFSAPSPSSPALKIGERWHISQRFDGEISDVRLYNKELTANEIATIYQEGRR